VAIALGAPAAVRIWALLDARAPFVTSVRDLQRALLLAIDARPDLCYGGTLDGTLAELHPQFTPLELLGTAACEGDGRTPAYLSSARGDGPWLVALGAPADAEVTGLSASIAQADGSSLVAHTLSGSKLEIGYERGFWGLYDDGLPQAGFWHVAHDDRVLVSFRSIAGTWYAFADDRVIAPVEAIDPLGAVSVDATWERRGESLWIGPVRPPD
jgi:hypothetical protein